MSKWIRSRNWTPKRDFYLKELTQGEVKLTAATLDEEFWIELKVSELKQLAQYSYLQKYGVDTKGEFTLNTVNHNPMGFSSWTRQLEGVVELTGESGSLAFGHQKQLGRQTRYPFYISCLDTDQRLGPGEFNPDHPDDPDDFLELEASTYGETFFNLNISKKRWLDITEAVQKNERFANMTIVGYFKKVYRGSGKIGPRLIVIFPDDTESDGEDGEELAIREHYTCSAKTCSVRISSVLIRGDANQKAIESPLEKHLMTIKMAAFATAFFTGLLVLVKLFEILAHQ